MSTLHRFRVDKLIRDRLPELMGQSGIKVGERVMEYQEYLKRLQDKLLEEAREVINSRCQKELLEELRDLLEVMKAIACVYGIEFEDIFKAADQKRAEKGGFERQIYKAFVEVDYFRTFVTPESYTFLIDPSSDNPRAV